MNINVGFVSFDLINMIFDEKLLIGKSVDFLRIFCIYIGRKWFELWVEIWDGRWVKVLIFVGFDDIGCDIWILIGKLVKCLILLGLIRFLFRSLKMKFV